MSRSNLSRRQLLESLMYNRKNYTYQLDQHRIQSRLVQGIVNARAKVNCCSKSTTNLGQPQRIPAVYPIETSPSCSNSPQKHQLLDLNKDRFLNRAQ